MFRLGYIYLILIHSVHLVGVETYLVHMQQKGTVF